MAKTYNPRNIPKESFYIMTGVVGGLAILAGIAFVAVILAPYLIGK